ncbi:MAG: XRE family transcriptional regulator [Bacteroidales bacterium]|nr:XRE family transcriptional regulator [Bacteroidales bacterium]
MDMQVPLKSLRKARGMTQSELGILAGMSKSQISRMEHGSLGSPETFGRLLDALGYEVRFQFHDRWALSEKRRVMDCLQAYYVHNKDRLGIERLGLFGSFVREEQTPQSDVDICISLARPSLFLYAEITEDLERILGRDIDLVSLKSRMPAGFREQLEKEAEYVG